jgi:hypothetical protein
VRLPRLSGRPLGDKVAAENGQIVTRQPTGADRRSESTDAHIVSRASRRLAWISTLECRCLRIMVVAGRTTRYPDSISDVRLGAGCERRIRDRRFSIEPEDSSGPIRSGSTPGCGGTVFLGSMAVLFGSSRALACGFREPRPHAELAPDSWCEAFGPVTLRQVGIAVLSLSPNSTVHRTLNRAARVVVCYSLPRGSTPVSADPLGA